MASNYRRCIAWICGALVLGYVYQVKATVGYAGVTVLNVSGHGGYFVSVQTATNGAYTEGSGSLGPAGCGGTTGQWGAFTHNTGGLVAWIETGDGLRSTVVTLGVNATGCNGVMYLDCNAAGQTTLSNAGAVYPAQTGVWIANDSGTTNTYTAVFDDGTSQVLGTLTNGGGSAYTVQHNGPAPFKIVNSAGQTVAAINTGQWSFSGVEGVDLGLSSAVRDMGTRASVSQQTNVGGAVTPPLMVYTSGTAADNGTLSKGLFEINQSTRNVQLATEVSHGALTNLLTNLFGQLGSNFGSNLDSAVLRQIQTNTSTNATLGALQYTDTTNFNARGVYDLTNGLVARAEGFRADSSNAFGSGLSNAFPFAGFAPSGAATGAVGSAMTVLVVGRGSDTGTDWSWNLNPFESVWFRTLCSWVRSILVWAASFGLLVRVFTDFTGYARQLVMVQPQRSSGQAILGTNVNAVVAFLMALAVTVVIIGFATIFTGGLSQLAVSALPVSGVGSPGADGGLAMSGVDLNSAIAYAHGWVNLIAPWEYVVSLWVGYQVWRMTVFGAFMGSATVIRFLTACAVFCCLTFDASAYRVKLEIYNIDYDPSGGQWLLLENVSTPWHYYATYISAGSSEQIDNLGYDTSFTDWVITDYSNVEIARITQGADPDELIVFQMQGDGTPYTGGGGGGSTADADAIWAFWRSFNLVFILGGCLWMVWILRRSMRATQTGGLG